MKKRLISEAPATWTDYITQVQKKLKELYPEVNLGKTGPNKDGVDGKFGELTRQALLKFQLDNGAGPGAKGYPGKWTARKLGLTYVAPDMVTNVPGKTEEPVTDQKCSKYDLAKSTENVRSKICKGQTRNLGKTNIDGCAAWVANQTGKWQGNAWHAYKTKGYPGLSGFKSFFASDQNKQKAATAFQKINSSSQSVKDAKGKADSEVRSMMVQAVPPQSTFSNLNQNDVVGLFYPRSEHHSEAFFQAATGMLPDGRKPYEGPYFRVKEGNTTRKWEPKDLGKKVEIVPGNYLMKGDHFGFNTHLGFVGGKTPEGEPIIFHNVSGEILATPLSDMGKKFSIIWARPA